MCIREGDCHHNSVQVDRRPIAIDLFQDLLVVFSRCQPFEHVSYLSDGVGLGF
jgi:hypothetical protein